FRAKSRAASSSAASRPAFAVATAAAVVAAAAAVALSTVAGVVDWPFVAVVGVAADALDVVEAAGPAGDAAAGFALPPRSPSPERTPARPAERIALPMRFGTSSP